ncbi:hypothetical protein HBI56_174210 [Parastagonospora nodorum]|nr:hypothetical protein HBH56_119680 [Parastagonospora nodorum]KAH3924300.1 hypothetical protein HBH54_195580 [Parastagonospora nodorum]KAH3942403.1 hypothetical protein HBH53_187920 [Parastagonospora nodorum]KAH3956690.1 hypothetical protein HBH51_236920 [Parastagonospora nodorum]KAH3968410.1 hypothetical protein HBH52_178040 [Parastagonospora nodorum]
MKPPFTPSTDWFFAPLAQSLFRYSVHLASVQSDQVLVGTVASGVMGYFAFVPASGLYATLQSASMGGYGASFAAGAAQVGAVASSAVAWAVGLASVNATQTICCALWGLLQAPPLAMLQ